MARSMADSQISSYVGVAGGSTRDRAAPITGGFPGVSCLATLWAAGKGGPPMTGKPGRVALAALGTVTATGTLSGCADPNDPMVTPWYTPSCPAPALRDGTFTGAVVTTARGDLRVEIEVTAGRISDIRVPVFPDEVLNSQIINQDAVPQLIERGLAAQCAIVDSVVGATYTSESYRQSLQAAIDKAAR